MSTLPSQEELSKQLGCPVPIPLVAIIRIAHEVSGGDSEMYSAPYRNPGPLYLAGDSARYSTTPPELFPISRTRVDGEHWGYVVHAPELHEDDFPLATYCPMDSDGVLPLGMNTRDAWVRLLADSSGELPRDFVERVTDELKLTAPSEALPEKLVPFCPRGWRYLPTQDGVGVLAPSEAFDNDLHPPALGTSDSLLATVVHALESRRPATALALIKEAWWQSGDPEEFLLLFHDVWIASYEALDRKVLADVIRRAKQRADKTVNERRDWKDQRGAILAEFWRRRSGE